jgi:hypothetical protein
MKPFLCTLVREVDSRVVDVVIVERLDAGPEEIETNDQIFRRTGRTHDRDFDNRVDAAARLSEIYRKGR